VLGQELCGQPANRLKRRRQVLHSGVMLLLVPADPLRPRRADERFAAEAAAAREAGVTVALIDHDALADPGEAERAVARVPASDGLAVYRGWMLRASSALFGIRGYRVSGGDFVLKPSVSRSQPG
jgi:hypothetical protein